MAREKSLTCPMSDQPATWKWCRWMLLLTLVSLSGCSGCRPDGDQLSREELEERAKKRSAALQVYDLVGLPTDIESKILNAKPGHWHETQQQFKSNREDLQVVAVGSIARGSEPAKIPGTQMVNEFTRRTSLPKGQTKTIDLKYFVPFSGKKADPFSTLSNRLTFRTELLSWPLMTPILQTPNLEFANELLEHEFQLVALSPQSLSYSYLTVLDAIHWRGDTLMPDERTRSYFVSLVGPSEGKYAFPRSMLTMTAIAVIVWDDVSPDELSAEQQDAIIDWVHWGGQLIVSGPSSWSRLQNSFLSPYLPASSADATEFTTEEFSPMSQTWMVEDRSAAGTRDPLEIVGAPVGGLKFKLHGRGSWLPGSGQLVAESQVGRGRIVLTGFPMREPRIFRWKYFSNFFSTGLLRRHPRMIRRNTEDRTLAQFWAKPFGNAEHDARLHSNLRILTRDLPLSKVAAGGVEIAQLPNAGGDSFSQIEDNQMNAPRLDGKLASEAMQWGGRAAAWNDYSGMSFQVLAALRAAAGIELPSRKTIIYLLAGYLACLVPLNWLLFRAIGRLEFAWLAAPLMAVIGVVVVTKVARLDIGFARRTTEISVLELHGDHTRGHLTQYLALYTSLSTNYAVDFPENDSVALPLGDVSRKVLRAGEGAQTLKTNYGVSEGVRLEPLTVYSNSTEMLHAEQIIPLAGGILLGRRGSGEDSQDDQQTQAGSEAVKNETGIQLLGAMIVRRTEAGSIEMAWIGDLATGQSAMLQYEPITTQRLWHNWRQNPVTQPNQPDQSADAASDAEALWIGGVLHELVRKTPLMPGQTRLFAHTDDRISKLAITPAEDQYDGRCVIVAHLTPQILGDVVPDLNISSRVSSGLLGPGSDLDAELELGLQADP